MPEAGGSTVRLGVIDLPSFYATFDLGSSRRIQLASGGAQPELKSTTADVQRLLKKLQSEGVHGIILDLRRNGEARSSDPPHGSVHQGLARSSRSRMPTAISSIESDPDPEKVLYDGPLIVLTSRFSASASEILAAALQDYGRALIVGDTSTHGKGTVQTIYELNKFANFRNYNAGALKVTIRKFYRANGWSTQLKGVTPGIILPSVANDLEVGESSQPFPMPWDSIASAMYEKLDRIQPHIDELHRRTETRAQADDREFAYVREDVVRYRDLLADKSVSLNEAQRIKEKEDLEAKLKARKEERKSAANRPSKPTKSPSRMPICPACPDPVQPDQPGRPR